MNNIDYKWIAELIIGDSLDAKSLNIKYLKGYEITNMFDKFNNKLSLKPCTDSRWFYTTEILKNFNDNQLVSFIYWFIIDGFRSSFSNKQEYENNLSKLLEMLQFKVRNIMDIILKQKPDLLTLLDIKNPKTENSQNTLKVTGGGYWMFMDFNPEEEWKYDAAKDFFSKRNIELKRMDKSYKLENKNETIITRIENAIKSADLCIFDISKNNCNVFFELGYARALNKDHLIFNIDSNNELPFNVKAHAYHNYKTPNDIKKILEKLLNKY